MSVPAGRGGAYLSLIHMKQAIPDRSDHISADNSISYAILEGIRLSK